jgi:opacity protein-like surface antigen
MLLLGAMLCLSVAARAQENDSTLAYPASTAAPAAPQGGGSGLTAWQLTVGYQFNHLNPQGRQLNTNGVNLSLVKFVHNKFALEGNVGAGFGHTGGSVAGCPINCVNTVFLGGGLHYSIVRDRRFEPWVHGVLGWEHFRVSQTATYNSLNAFGYLLGGGVDWNFNPRTALRGEVDYLGTAYSGLRILGSSDNNIQAVAGLVINF